MKCLQFLVILSAWTCLSVSVGIRVPSAWDAVPKQDGVGSYDGRINSNLHRFGNVNRRQGDDSRNLERRMLIKNEQASAELGSLYNTLQSSALSNFFGQPQQVLVVGPNGVYTLPQNTQENVTPISSETKQFMTELPPLRHPRYPQNLQLQNNNILHEKTSNNLPSVPLAIGTSQYQQIPQTIPVGFIENKAFDQYQTLPSNVLRIMPSSSGNGNWNNYAEQPVLKQPVVKQFVQNYKPLVYKEYARTPDVSYGTQVEVPTRSLKNHIAQDDTFIVSASTLSSIESDPNQDQSSGEFITKKEPIFFVTEGYRNVLIQGPNKKKKYQKPHYQNQEASRKVLKTEILENDDDNSENDEDNEKLPRNRKVTKIYKIHGTHGQQENNVGGSSRNLVQEGYEKPRQYFQRPPIKDDRTSGLKNHLTQNHRDDRLHEPNDDNDSEREDDDKERIEDVRNESDNENEEELEVENKSEDDEESNNDDVTQSEKNETEKEKPNENKESDDNEETDDDDVEDEEEEEENEENQREVPHSEHADPKPVPTKPIYPGEGVWAKPGVKHRTHISQHRFVKPQEVEQKPDGHEVFEDLEKYFVNQKDQFGRTFGQKVDHPGRPVADIQINPPNSVNPIVVYDPFNESSNRKDIHKIPNTDTVSNHQTTDNDIPENTNQEQNIEGHEESDDVENETVEETNDNQEETDKKEEFVPVQLYTQVRKSEDEKHEAHDPLEHGRLREVIKDSKIQTVYSEEGFEDAAYDHAGHEKKAEQDQGHEEFEREKVKKGKQKDNKELDSHAGQSNKVLVPDVLVEDSLPSYSIYPSLANDGFVENIKTSTTPPQKHQPSNKKNFITTQEVKTTQVKDKKNGDVQLEIQSEVKVIVQPNNSTKAHKYVKIYPKVLREYSKDPTEDSKEGTDGETKEELLSSLSTTERSNMNADKTLVATEVNYKSENIEGDILADIHKNVKTVKNYISTDSQVATDSESTTKPISAAKVSVKAFADEFNKATSSEKPKVTVKVLDDEATIAKISDEFGKIGKVRRRRSASEADKDLEIDLGFIDKINHTFAEKKPETIDVEKYPYYTLPDLNENSPLRYAENMDNIPVKVGGELSFYKMADRLECPDLPQSIDPIPEHVKNADENTEQSDDEEYDDDEEEENDESDEQNNEEENEDESIVDQKHPKTPRIQLGDKIDCLKTRYFGDNPLDSPFFKEETVGPVKSIFKELDNKSAKIQTYKKIDIPQETSEIVKNTSKANEIFNQSDKKPERKFESEVKDKVYNALKETAQRNGINNKAISIENEYDNAASINTDVKIRKPIDSEISSKSQLVNHTPLPLVTLITTPKYTLQLKPKNIYDQITLLDHLPEDEIVTEIIETSTRSIKATIAEKKAKEQVTTDISAQKRIDQVDGKKESSRRESKSLKEESVDQKEYEQKSPEADALRRRRFRPRKPLYQIFDVNKFLTTTPYSIINSVHSTVLPKHKVISEVFYKDEIKPNEQLNVFADILNNIKNSTHVDTLPLQSASDFAEPDAVTISNLEEQVQTSPNIRVKKYQRDSSNNHNFIDRNPLQNIPTTEKHFNARFPDAYEEHHRTRSSTNKNIVNLISNNPDNFGYMDETTRHTAKNFYSDEDAGTYSNYPNTKVVPSTKRTLRRRRKPTKGTTTTSTTYRTTTNINVPAQSQSTPSNHKPYVIDVFDDSNDVVGLVPPGNGVYKTIVGDSDGTGTNEVPLQVYEYKTIPPSYVTEPLTGVAAVTELIDKDTPSVRPMNKYYFLGLKPPSNQRARSYPEFINKNNVVNANNNIRRRMTNVGYGHIRLKRGAARATYSEVSRNRGSQSEGLRKETTTPYDDTDDYIPHRPKNYHYDEKTGKIVYHNKPKEEKESEEEEEEYDEIPDTPGIYLETADDATHPTPKKVTTKPLLATATPPPAGQGLLDFVAKLKNNPSYEFIPDPTTPDPSSKSTTQETVTIDPKSTNPPEFLSILSKVKSDNNYKYIEDPKESKSKVKPTTPEPEIEEEEEEEEEEGSPHRPHRRIVRQTDLQIFNIGDYLPKIQTPISSPIPKTPTNFFKKQIVERIFPKLRYMTPLDIAKEKIKERFQNNTVYKFIQKNIQNSPGGQSQDLSNIQIFDIGDYLPKIKTVSPKTSIDYSKYKTIERPHTRHNMSSRYNSDEEPNLEDVVTMRRPIIMEERESIDAPVVSKEKIVHDKKVEIATERVTPSTTQKIVQFRRGTRPTTQRTIAETVKPSESVATRRTANRRRPVPTGFRTTKRPTTTEVTEATERVQKIYPQNSQTEKTYPQTHDHAKRVYRKRPVRIRYTTERHEEDDDSVDKIARRSIDLDYETDITNEFEKEYLEEQNIPQSYENIKRDIINSNKEGKKIIKSGTKELDNTEENEEVASTKEKDELIDENIQEKQASESNQREIILKAEKPVKIINNDINRKHDGNTKKEQKEDNLNIKYKIADNDKIVEPNTNNPSLIFDSKEEATENENRDEDVEIINHNYDKSKKHGGNYERQNEKKAIEEPEEIIDTEDITNEQAKLLDVTNIKSDVEIIKKNFDKSKRHGGNYKAEKDAITDEISIVDEHAAEIQQTDSTNHLKSDDLKTNNNQVKKSDKVADTLEVKVEGTNNNASESLNTRKRKRIIPKSIIKDNNTKKIPRLTDVVPKPDHYYTDTQLPKEVNNLKTKETDAKLDSKELEELSKNGDESDLEDTQKSSTGNRRKFNTNRENIPKDFVDNTDETDGKHNDRNIENESYKYLVNSDDDKEVATKKPVFIKDPSKRLYFYAPI